MRRRTSRPGAELRPLGRPRPDPAHLLGQERARSRRTRYCSRACARATTRASPCRTRSGFVPELNPASGSRSPTSGPKGGSGTRYVCGAGPAVLASSVLAKFKNAAPRSDIDAYEDEDEDEDEDKQYDSRRAPTTSPLNVSRRATTSSRRRLRAVFHSSCATVCEHVNTHAGLAVHRQYVSRFLVLFPFA
jgi:hypothetical protein